MNRDVADAVLQIACGVVVTLRDWRSMTPKQKAARVFAIDILGRSQPNKKQVMREAAAKIAKSGHGKA